MGVQGAPLAAEKRGYQILVEVKSFIGLSDIQDLYLALGQYIFYRSHLFDKGVDFPLYLAVPKAAYEGIWSEPAGRVVIESEKLKIMVFDINQEEIIKWID